MKQCYPSGGPYLLFLDFFETDCLQFLFYLFPSFFCCLYADLIETIEAKKELSKDVDAQLKAAIESFKKSGAY